MAVLNSTSLEAFEVKHNELKRQNSFPHGYPVSAITDLLDTIRSLRMLKKRFQRLAERRAKVIAEIYSTASRSISELDDTL